MLFYAVVFIVLGVIFKLLLSVKSNTDINSKNTESNKNISTTRKDYLTPTSRRNIVAKESSSPIEDNNFDIDIKKLNVAYTKELNKNSW